MNPRHRDRHNNSNGALIPPGHLDVSNTLPTYAGGEESFVWFGLVLLAAKTKERNLTALITLLHLVVRMFFLNDKNDSSDRSNSLPSSNYYRRQERSNNHKRDADGMAASIVLVPVLFQSIDRAATDSSSEAGMHTRGLQLYAFSMAVTLPLIWQPYPFIRMLGPVLTSACLCWFIPRLSSDWMWVFGRQVIFLACWMTIYSSLPIAKSLHRVFTKGEWITVTSLLAVGVTEFLLWDDESLTGGTNEDGKDCDCVHHLVSISLLIGSGIAFATVDFVTLSSSVRNRLLSRLLYLSVIPVACIEVALWRYASTILSEINNSSNFYYPRSLFWLLDFLRKAEEPIGFGQQWQPVVLIPRFYWLAYWMGVLVITIPLALPSSTSRRTRSVVLTRKWFHFIAILLFVPVTLAAPKLQSLAYAIASALLLLTECIRHDLTSIQQFYESFLDMAKGEGSHEGMVISHLALIVGCAAPLWLTELVSQKAIANSDRNDSVSMNVLTALWGVLTLGIGDAIGAVVGTTVGRIQWGYGRTVEGSLSMWLSMVLIGYLLLYTVAATKEEAWELLPVGVVAVTLVTLLEAFTLQLDNLILPLAGTAVLFLQSSS